MSKLCMIYASTRSGVIGKGNSLPWDLPEDLANFKALTMGHAIIMGRLTFESLKNKPLPGRKNIVVTSQQLDVPGVYCCVSLDEAIRVAKALDCEKTFVIGGKRLFEEAFTKVDEIYHTLVEEDIEGDVAVDINIQPRDWIFVSRTFHTTSSEKNPGLNFQFRYYWRA